MERVKMNVWQRICFAVKMLWSEQPLNKVVAKELEKELHDVAEQYLAVKEKLIPIIEEAYTRVDKDDRFIAPPQTEQMVLQTVSLPKDFNPVASCYPADPMHYENQTYVYKTYKGERIFLNQHVNMALQQMVKDARYGKMLEHTRLHAAHKLGEKLMEMGYIKVSTPVSINPYEQDIHFWALLFKR